MNSEITPIPLLKTFLMRYVDENAIFRRQSQSEDDNPPSPTETAVEVGTGGATSGSGGNKAPFQTPATPNQGGSNPLTPSSPAAGVSNSNQFLQSPPANIRPQVRFAMLRVSRSPTHLCYYSNKRKYFSSMYVVVFAARCPLPEVQATRDRCLHRQPQDHRSPLRPCQQPCLLQGQAQGQAHKQWLASLLRLRADQDQIIQDQV